MKGRVLLVALALNLLWLTAMAEGTTFDVSTQAEFQAALTAAQSNGQDDIINVQANVNITTILTYLTTNGDNGRTLTINGNGYYLDGGNLVQIMRINTDNDNNGGDAGGDVTIDSLTLQNGNFSVAGGGLYIRTREANITLTNNTFSGNQAGYDGGGAYVWLSVDTATANIYNNII